MKSRSSPQACRVDAPARLHLGFLDPGASRGRRFGSLGLAVDDLLTKVVVEPDDELVVTGLEQARVADLVERLLAHYHLPRRLAVHVEAAIPAHAGLGSGTQLALAVGRAVTTACGRDVTTAELAQVLGRGRRSGIGIGLFDHGGLVVDGGHGAASATPPLVARLAFPAAWRVVLVFDHAATGLSGGAEVEAFRRLEPLPASCAAHLCHLTLMQLLPAVAEHDFAPFAAAVGEIQAVVGDHFAPVQCGRYTSRAVCLAIEHAAQCHGLRGVGQSSWGPTGFLFVPDDAGAREVVASLEALRAAHPTLAFQVLAARDRGADIQRYAQAPARRQAGI